MISYLKTFLPIVQYSKTVTDNIMKNQNNVKNMTSIVAKSPKLLPAKKKIVQELILHSLLYHHVHYQWILHNHKVKKIKFFKLNPELDLITGQHWKKVLFMSMKLWDMVKCKELLLGNVIQELMVKGRIRWMEEWLIKKYKKKNVFELIV